MSAKVKFAGYPFLSEAHPKWKVEDQLPPKQNQHQGPPANLHVVKTVAKQQSEQTQQ